MSILRKFLLFAMAFLFVANTHAEAAKRYELKSGYVKYVGNNGEEELYWDNYGEKEARYRNQTITVFGMTNTDNTIDIIDGKWAYSHQVGSNTVTRVDYQKMMETMMGGKSGKPLNFSEKMIEEWGGTKIGTEKILNKKTNKYKFDRFGDYIVWLFKGVPLKWEANAVGMTFAMEAVEFKENARVDKTKFHLPPNLELVDGMKDMPTAEEMQAYQNQRKQMMNDPEYQESMQKMQQLQNSPEFADALKQMQELQNSPEFADAMKQMQDVQNNPEFKEALRAAQEAQSQGYKNSRSGNSQGTMPQRAQQIIKEETDSAVEDTIRETTRDGLKKALGGGLKSIFNN